MAARKGQQNAQLSAQPAERLYRLAIAARPALHRAELAKGVVHPEFRGMHFVQLALREITRRAERLGVEQLVLDVREHTRAHRLWQFFGFETYGVLEDYARAQGRVHRGHFMAQAVRALRLRVDATPLQ